MKTNQKGFSVIEIIIVVVVIGLIGVVGWLAYDRLNNKTTDTSNQQTGNSQKETPKQEEKQVDPNKGYLVVKEWGLRFKVPSGLTDAQYAIRDDELALFAKPSGSNVQYVSNYKEYKDGNFQYPVGVVYRSTSSTKLFMNDITREGKKVGNYYYYTAWAFSNLATGAGCAGLFGDSESACQAESKAYQLVNKGDTGLLNTIELAQ